MFVDMLMIFGTAEILDDQGTDIQAYSDMPPATTGEEVRVCDLATDSKAKSNEENLSVQQETIYEVLTVVVKAMVHSAMQISQRETYLTRSSGTNVYVTLGTDAQDQSLTSGIDASSYGAIEQT